MKQKGLKRLGSFLLTLPLSMQSGRMASAPEWADSLKLSSYGIPLATETGPWTGRPKSTHTDQLQGVACRGLLGENSLLPLVTLSEVILTLPLDLSHLSVVPATATAVL